jgi:transmembrane sensor
MMDKYIHFGVEDLVWDPYFRQWVLSPTRENDASWHKWLSENAGVAEKVARATEIVLSLRVVETTLSQEEIDRSVGRTITKINHPNSPTMPQGRLMPMYKAVWFRIAASVALLLTAGFLAKSYFSPENLSVKTYVRQIISKPEYITRQNDTETSMIIELPDKSRVVLSPGSHIKYKEIFLNERREIFLVGEAFFDVYKDPHHPFFVYANELVTKVLGTSFTVTAFEKSPEITVAVKTGRVSVFSKSDGAELEGLVLSPNQKIIYKRDEVRLVRTLVKNPEIIVSKALTPQFSFEDTPVSEVFEAVEKAYGIDILYDAELLKDCPLTATLENQLLNEKLMIICRAVEATYEVLDGQIVIHSKGCRN